MLLIFSVFFTKLLTLTYSQKNLEKYIFNAYSLYYIKDVLFKILIHFQFISLQNFIGLFYFNRRYVGKYGS